MFAQLFSGLAPALDRQAATLRRAGDDVLRAVAADGRARYILFSSLRPLVASCDGPTRDGAARCRLARLPLAAVAAVGADAATAPSCLLGTDRAAGGAPLVVVDVTPSGGGGRVAPELQAALDDRMLTGLRAAGFLPGECRARGAGTGGGAGGGTGAVCGACDGEGRLSYAFVHGDALLFRGGGGGARGGGARRAAAAAAAAAVHPRDLPWPLPFDEAALLGLGRSLLQWHAKCRFCGACGAPMAPVEGGVKKRCTACGDVAYPRTDPVVIALVTSADGARCLLSRQAKFPAGMYSCCAGYLEGGESVEEAVVRELAEETRVALRAADVRYVASQPWPLARGAFGQLMIGATVRAAGDDGSGAVDFDREELSDARWFSREQVRAALAAGDRSGLGGDGGDAGALRVPGPYAIAHALLRGWAFE